LRIFQARALLASAYDFGKMREDRPMLNHAMKVTADGDDADTRTLCRKVLADRLVDSYGMADDDHVTCPECLRRLEKLGAK
jgi:hypothetical protein